MSRAAEFQTRPTIPLGTRGYFSELAWGREPVHCICVGRVNPRPPAIPAIFRCSYTFNCCRVCLSLSPGTTFVLRARWQRSEKKIHRVYIYTALAAAILSRVHKYIRTRAGALISPGFRLQQRSRAQPVVAGGATLETGSNVCVYIARSRVRVCIAGTETGKPESRGFAN